VRCDRCGRALRPGALKFAVHISVTADFDGHLSEPGQEQECSLAQALSQADELSEEELAAGVHQELAFLLCPACRAALVADPLAAPFLRHGGGMVQ
jgi:hypothetical protein